MGVNVPLWGRNIGATRPKKDHVRIDKRDPRRLTTEQVQVDGELADIHTRALAGEDLTPTESTRFVAFVNTYVATIEVHHG